jgi:transposase
MDLWTPYLDGAKSHLKSMMVVFDKLHVFNYLSEAIDDVRRHEQASCSDEEGKLTKGSRWLWLKAKGKFRRSQKRALEEVIAVNKRLQRADLLKEDFEAFYERESKEAATSFLKKWARRCTQEGLQPFITMARRLNRCSEGVLSYFEHRITNGVVEGINNKIKVFKRRSYGFHDEEYYFLKILNACGATPSPKSINHPKNS